MNPYLMAAFNDELEKISGVDQLYPYIGIDADMEKEAFTPKFALRLLRHKNPRVKSLGRKMGRFMQAGPTMVRATDDVANFASLFPIK